ncbi:pirin-like protein [Iris pallida]|uniref:Pirin-like protein n=1 Tax=Iris pallida TaxID=29817 RepID=A0AAX6HV00_IRIPA|nr:pirin-like protein [Iris pallida]
MGMSANCEAPSFEMPRSVVKKVLAEAQQEGEGASVRRSIGRPELKNLDPFLMLDEFSVSAPAGFPDHPHRGFETVTYMLEGAFTHQDFSGHKSTIRAGDLQWMTAGRGVVHSEMPAAEGVQKGLQLWINLPSKDKMIEPRYQELQSKDIARAEKDGSRGADHRRRGLRRAVPRLHPHPDNVPRLHNAARLAAPSARPRVVERVRVRHRGRRRVRRDLRPRATTCWSSARATGSACGTGRTVRSGSFSSEGSSWTSRWFSTGRFVMNTQAEIQQTLEDYRNCRNGFEKARKWSS